MSLNFSGAITAHKKHIKELIYSSNNELTLRLAPTRTSTGVNPLFGDTSRETSKDGDVKGPYKCLWYDAYTVKSAGKSGTGFSPTIAEAMGQYRDATAFAEVWLDDVLIANEETWFDRARDVIHDGKRFVMIGFTTLGLATSLPYIGVVMLKGREND